MSGTLGSHQLTAFTTPTNGTTNDATGVSGNDNTIATATNAHDNDAGIHLPSGLHSARPGTPASQDKYWETDTKRLFRYTGSAWEELAYALSVGFNVKDPAYGAVGDGTTDDTASVQAAITAAAGRPVFCPTGTYKITSQLTFVTTASTSFVPGLRLIGEGSANTIFDTRVASNAMLKIDTNAVANAYFQRAVWIQGITISGEYGSPASADGIYLRHAQHVVFDDVRIKSLTGTGLHIPVTEGDTDGCTQLAFVNSRIETCATWGLHVDCSTGRNECSYLTLDNSFISQCGTSSGSATPPSGGLRWRGQVMTLRNGAITECENVGLYIYGGSGTALGLTLSQFTLENNKKKALLCQGINGLVLDQIDMRTNDSFIETDGVYLDTTTQGITGVSIRSPIITVTTGNNPYTAFNAAGSSGGTFELINPIWRTFDGTGQTRVGAGVHACFTSAVHIRDGGFDLFSTGKHTRAAFTNPATNSATPDATAAESYTYAFNTGATGTFTQNVITSSSTPGIALDGRRIAFTYENNTAAAITLVLSGFLGSAIPTSVAAGQSLSVLVQFDNAVGWQIVGSDSVAVSNDLNSTGGYREALHGWSQATTVAASQTDVVLTDAAAARGRVMVRSGSITGVAANLSTAKSGGTITVRVQKSTDGGTNWATVSGPQASIGGGLQKGQATFAKDTYAFAAGDMLRATITTDGSFAPTANNLDATLEVES